MVVAALRPSVPGLQPGRHAIKRTLGEPLRVEADLIVDGHDLLAARLHVRHEADAGWTVVPMQRVGPHQPDRFAADVVVDRLGTWLYRVER